MANVQKRVDERSKQSALYRAFHVLSDKRAIASWDRDFNRILHIFNVRSVWCVWHLLTAFFQTELHINVIAGMDRVDRGLLELKEMATTAAKPQARSVQ